jgi:hypothetical protein
MKPYPDRVRDSQDKTGELDAAAGLSVEAMYAAVTGNLCARHHLKHNSQQVLVSTTACSYTAPPNQESHFQAKTQTLLSCAVLPCARCCVLQV